MKRICCKCKVEKPIKEFVKHKKMKGGYDTICKKCNVKRVKEYYKENKEERLKYNKEYYKENKEALLKQQREYYKENKKNISERNKIYREKNKEKIGFWFKEYEKTATRKAFKANQRSKRRAAIKETNITTDFLIKLKEETKICILCESELNDINNNPRQYNLDHIVPLCIGGTHSKDNVRYICKKCNSSRPIDGSDLINDE